MKSVITLTASVLVLLCAGCASIVSGTHKKVNFASNPAGAQFKVRDENGKEVAQGITPQLVKLKTGKPYFVGKHYSIDFSLSGYKPQSVELKSSFNGWYIGNILFGGLVGMIIVDPLTGAVYTLQKELIVDLQSASAQTDEGLRVVSVEDVPSYLLPHLIPIK